MRAQLGGVLWPAVCVALGIALVTLYIDRSAASGAQTFGLACGVCFGTVSVRTLRHYYEMLTS